MGHTHPTPHILAFAMLGGQPPEQSLQSSGETRIARLTTEKPPYLYPAAWQLAGKDTRTVTLNLQKLKPKRNGYLHTKNPNYNGILATKFQPTD